MIKTYEKFLFLGIIVALAFFSRAAYPLARRPADTGMAMAARTGAEPPVLVLSSGNGSTPADPAQGTAGDPPAPGASAATPPSSFTQTGNAPAPAFKGASALVADLESGTVFYAVTPSGRWPTASLTKLMTATVVADTMDLDTRITITEDMFAHDPEEATLALGGSYTVRDLMRIMLLPSSNVAAEALASFYGRSAFMETMNARAKAWGMADTYFDDPSGISAANQSTANDFLTLARVVYDRYPTIFSTTRTPASTITEMGSGKRSAIQSINQFAGQADFVGGKTGHTEEASGNLLSIFRYDGHPLFIVVLGTDDRFGDTSKLYGWFKTNFR